MSHPLNQFKFCPKCGSTDFIINNEKSKKCNQHHFKVKIATSLVVVGFGVIVNFIHILLKIATTLDL